ncbi:MAG TPA: SAM-dependent methyltransferase [Bacteroidales bacterium]|nr:SAM-dependent methyltransferase [Bacteroidales bacterium]
MDNETIIKLKDLFEDAVSKRQFVRMTLSKTRQKGSEPKRVDIKPVLLKAGMKISFHYQYHTRDEVKNHSAEEASTLFTDLLDKHFLEANFFSLKQHSTLMMNGKGNARLITKNLEQEAAVDLAHDRKKKRRISAKGLHWYLLGMTDQQGVVLSSMQHKFKQINKYIEILDTLIAPWLQDGEVSIVDMGAGKGYLTFALYEYLAQNEKIKPSVTGVEQRPELVEKTNAIAESAGLAGLRFEEGSINAFAMPRTDVLIALHACDTATDDAIAAGIAAGARLIVCAPCCHKQIRKEMQATARDLPVLKYGILFERQAEIVTDTLRALIMEKYGYQTHIQEFIEAEHTPKNVLLSGYKHKKPVDVRLIDGKITQLKKEFGIKDHFLEIALQQKGL